MDFEESKDALGKSVIEEEHSENIGQSHFTCVWAKDWTTLETSGLIDSSIQSGPLDGKQSLGALLGATDVILYPTLSFRDIPDLLDILTQVEHARELSIKNAKQALLRQRFYQSRPSSRHRVLQKSDKEAIEMLLCPERLDTTRRIFICVFEQVIRMVRAFSTSHVGPWADMFQARLSPLDTRRGIISFAPLSPHVLSVGAWQTRRERTVVSRVANSRRASAACRSRNVLLRLHE